MVGERSTASLSLTSFPRPVRAAIILAEPTSSRALRTVVRSLCGVWGGSRSVIVTGSRSTPISDKWLGAVLAIDPDVFFLSERLYRRDTRERLGAFLDRHHCTPFFVAKMNPSLEMAPALRASTIASVLQDSPSPNAGASRRSSPVEVAVRGIGFEVSAKAPHRLPTTTTFVRNSPAGYAATSVPGFRVAGTGDIYLLHEQADVRAALWLWNLRGVYGSVRHGNATQLVHDLTVRPALAATLRQIVCLDRPSAKSKSEVARLTRARLVDSGDFQWGGTGRTSLIFDLERDDVTAIADQFSIPRRTPVLRMPGLGATRAEASGIDGAYAIELTIQPTDPAGRRVSVPARWASRNLILSARSGPPSAPNTQASSRPTRSGDGVLLVRPARFARSVSLALPVVGHALTRLTNGVRFELSDKGYYTRWFVQHSGGLTETQQLLTDPRGAVLFEAFRSHHISGKRPVRTYRRFMNLEDMKAEFAQVRSVGRLPRRFPEPDSAYLERWIGRLAGAGILRLGILTKCQECLDTSFLAVGTFGTTYACPRCGESARTPAIPLVGYQLAEVAHQFLANDGDVTVLAVAAMSRRTAGGFSFDFEHDVIDGPSKREIDFIAVIDGRVVIGESKKTGDIDAGDCNTFQRVAGQVRASTVVLATNTECGPCTDACVGDNRDPYLSRDQALPSGGGTSTGPRERVEELRKRLLPETRTVVLCRRDLHAAMGG